MSDDRVGPRVAAVLEGLAVPQAEPAGAQPTVVSGLSAGRVTAHGGTRRARLPRASGTGSGSGIHQMPRRRPGIDAAAASDGPDAEPATQHLGDGPDFTPVSVDSLRQVLDGLRGLS